MTTKPTATATAKTPLRFADKPAAPLLPPIVRPPPELLLPVDDEEPAVPVAVLPPRPLPRPPPRVAVLPEPEPPMDPVEPPEEPEPEPLEPPLTG